MELEKMIAQVPAIQYVTWYGSDGHHWEYYADENGKPRLGAGSQSWHVEGDCRGCDEGAPIFDW